MWMWAPIIIFRRDKDRSEKIKEANILMADSRKVQLILLEESSTLAKKYSVFVVYQSFLSFPGFSKIFTRKVIALRMV